MKCSKCKFCKEYDEPLEDYANVIVQNHFCIQVKEVVDPAIIMTCNMYEEV